MANRNGEKIGWLGGWAGGFSWVGILAIVWLLQGKVLEGLTGIILALAAAFLIITLAPWRHPAVIYWKLLIPIYLVLFLSVGWAIWAFGGVRQAGFSVWSLFLLAVLLLPLWQTSRRRWQDVEDETNKNDG
jgi:hypothetical protein